MITNPISVSSNLLSDSSLPYSYYQKYLHMEWHSQNDADGAEITDSNGTMISDLLAL